MMKESPTLLQQRAQFPVLLPHVVTMMKISPTPLQLIVQLAHVPFHVTMVKESPTLLQPLPQLTQLISWMRLQW